MNRSFSESALYAYLGLSKPFWDEFLGADVCRELSDVERRCILNSALRYDTEDELRLAAEEYFDEKAVFFRDEDGALRESHIVI